MGRRSRSRIDSPLEVAGIRDMTIEGRGVIDTDEKTVFVDGAITGERVRFKRNKRKKNYDEAELVEVLEPAATRVEPECEYFGICGGCALQHVDAQAQLLLKQDSLFQALSRLGSVEAESILPPLGGDRFGYRRRARLGARYVEKKGRVLVGFREKRNPYIADMDSCETLTPRLGVLIRPLIDLVSELSIKRAVPQVEMSQGDNAVALTIRVLETPSAKDLAAFTAFALKWDVQLWLQTGGPSSVALLDTGVSAEPLRYELQDYDLQLEFGPQDFIQVNQDMNRRMLKQAMELMNPQSGQKILDLFCGIGNFSLPLARLGADVVGVELDPGMVRKAAHNAELNKLSNVRFVAADLAQGDFTQDWQHGFDSVLLDPPRAGALEVLPAVAATGAKQILYVSCHPGSLARDAGELVRKYGYQLLAAGVMDMFPQTSHVESMALFEKVS